MGCGAAPLPTMTVSRMRYRTGISPFAAKAAWGLGKWAGNKIGNYIGNAYKRRKTTSSGSSARSGTNNVTFQHDYAHIYSRKRAPRKVRVRARKNAYRFAKNLVSSLGQKTWNRSALFESGTITPTGLDNSQSVFDIGLYGGATTGSNTWGDLYQIALGNGTGLNDVTGKLWFQSACLDVQLKNTTGLEGYPDPVTICVELYTVYCRKEGYFFPGEDWAEAMKDQDLLDNGGTLATPLSINCTPFDAPGFGSSWLIAKKVRYRISPGNSVYLQMRDPKRKCFNTERFEYDTTGPQTRMKTFKGFTRGYIMVVRSDTGFVVETIPKLVPFSYQVIYTKNYKYAQQESNRDAQVFNP